MSKLRSSTPGAKPAAAAQFIVVSNRGAKPLGISCAHSRRASGISCAYGTSTTVRAGCAHRSAIKARSVTISERRTAGA